MIYLIDIILNTALHYVIHGKEEGPETIKGKPVEPS